MPRERFNTWCVGDTPTTIGDLNNWTGRRNRGCSERLDLPDALSASWKDCKIIVTSTAPKASELDSVVRAFRTDDAKKLRNLLRGDIDVNRTNSIFGSSRIQLHHTLELEAVDCTAVLLESGANANAQDEMKQAALHTCVLRNCRSSMLTLLLQHGADPNLRDMYGNTPLMYAVLRENLSHAKCLLQHGAETVIQSKSAGTALGLAKKGSDIQKMLTIHEQFSVQWDFLMWRRLQKAFLKLGGVESQQSQHIMMALMTVERRLRIADDQKLSVVPCLPMEIWHFIFGFLRTIDFIDWTKVRISRTTHKSIQHIPGNAQPSVTPSRKRASSFNTQSQSRDFTTGRTRSNTVSASFPTGRTRSNTVSASFPTGRTRSNSGRTRSNTFSASVPTSPNETNAQQSSNRGVRQRTTSEGPVRRRGRERTRSISLEELLAM